MNRILLVISLFSLGSVCAQAQELGFSIGGHVPNPAAVLDVQAKNKGVLIPRINLESTTLLQGGANPEGVIVYNIGTTLAPGFYYWTGTQWDMLTGDSYISSELTRVEQKFETQINNIINGGEDQGTDISYLVSFNPDTNVYSYLKPNAAGGYDKTIIDLTAAVQVAETTTFFREELKVVKDPTDPTQTKEVTAAYIYFAEDVIKDWKVAHPNGNPVDDMDDDLGWRIDVLGVVNNNFREIFENTVNNEIINEIIKEAPNNVWVEDRGADGKFLVYLDENKDKHEVNLTQQETQTSIFRHEVATDGVAAPALETEELVVTELKKGDIYYSYVGEHGKIFYINMTNDVINSIQNSETLQQEIFNTVNEYNSIGGNVYYGKMDANSTEDVLYVIKNEVPERIDISQDILNVIESTTNEIIIEKILERTEVTVEADVADVAVGTSIDGSKIYKGKRNVTVNHTDGYDVTFTAPITVTPSKKVLVAGSDQFTHEPTNEKIESLLSATIISKVTKQVVTTNVTDVETKANNTLTFSFGLGNMYTALENGDYEVIFEYTAK